METVHAWRSESDQAVSLVAQRLMRWMQGVAPVGSDLDDVGRHIAIGLRDLMEAQSVLLLARPAGRDELWPLVWIQADKEQALFTFDATTAASEERPRLFAGRGLLSLPATAQWHTDAPPHGQVLLSDIIEVVRARRSLSPGAADKPALPGVPPALIVPLRSAAPDENSAQHLSDEDSAHIGNADESSVAGSNGHTAASLRGVALLWMQSDDGLSSDSLQVALHAAASQAAGWLEQAMRLERMIRSYHELAAVCAGAIDGRDARRSGHSEAVAHYCSLIAWSLGLNDLEIERIEFAGLLHDLGKVAVPDAILQKTAPLELDELEAVRASTQLGATWLEGVEGLREVAAIVRHQAERFDGGGYPDGLSGEAIPLGSRILAVAARFAAMTKSRADRAALSVVGGAVEAIAAESGRALDPRVVQAFLLAMGRRIEE